MTNPIGTTLVVGAGIGGTWSPLDLAATGCEIYLLGKGLAVDRTMAQPDKAFPTNDYTMCILSPKPVKCRLRRMCRRPFQQRGCETAQAYEMLDAVEIGE